MLLGLIAGAGALLSHLQIRQRRANGLRLVVPSLLIHGDEAGKAHTLVGGAEHMTGALGVDGHGVKHGVCHLGGQKPAPDQLVQLVLIRCQAAADLVGVQLHMGGADGLVGILSVALGLEGMETSVIIAIAIAMADKVRRGGHGLFGKPQGVGTHIGDKTQRALAGHIHAFVQLLSHHHGLLGSEAQLPGSLLLQGGGGEWGRGGTLLLRLFHIGNGKIFSGDVGNHLRGLLLAGKLLLLGAAVIVGNETAGLALTGEIYIQRPVFLRLESPDFILPIHYQTGGNALHPAGA